MKKIILLSALVSFTLFTACNKEDMAVETAPAIQETESLRTIDKTNNNNTLNADFTIDNEDNVLYEKDDLLLTNSSENAVSYHWDFGNDDTSTEANPNYKYEIHGLYTVTLTITDADGNTKQASDEIVVRCIFGGGNHNQ